MELISNSDDGDLFSGSASNVDVPKNVPRRVPKQLGENVAGPQQEQQQHPRLEEVSTAFHYLPFSTSSPTGIGESTKTPERCGRFVPKNLPTAGVALACVIVVTCVTVAISVAISIHFSLRGLRELASANANHIFDKHYTYVNQMLGQARTEADRMQYLVNAEFLPLPPNINDTSFNITEQTWQIAWQSAMIGNARFSNTSLGFPGIGFSDGQYIGAKDYFSDYMFSYYAHRLPNETVTSKLNYYIEIHDKEHGYVINRTYYKLRYDLYSRPFYADVRKVPNAFHWGDVALTTFPSVPSLAYSKPLFAPDGSFFAVVATFFELQRLDADFKHMARGSLAGVHLLDNNGRLVATSGARAAFQNTVIDPLYNLTEADLANGCTRSPYFFLSENSPNANYKTCQLTPFTLGDEPFLMLYQERRNWFARDDHESGTSSGGVQTIDLEGERFFTMVSPLSSLGSPADNNMDWRLVVLLKESDVTGSVTRGKNIAIAVTVAVVVCASLAVGVGLHFLLRPLDTVAKSMAAAFCENKDGSDDRSDISIASESSSPNMPPKPKRKSKQQPRTPSYLSEVATIQTAYWAMSDELRLLKAYIPEHLLMEIAASKAALEGGGFDDRSGPRDSTSAGTNPLRSHKASQNTTGDTAPKSSAVIGDDSVLVLGVGEDDPSSPVGHTPAAGLSLHFDAQQQPVQRRGLVQEWVDGGNAVPHADGRPLSERSSVAALVSPTDSEQQARPAAADVLQPANGADQAAARRRSASLGRGQAVAAPSLLSGQDWRLAPHNYDSRDASSKEGPPPVFFGDNVLVDRDISIAIVNIVQFHKYALRHHGTDITKNHAEIVKFVHATARACGGILETFMGDRFCVSFNATSRCQHHSVSAVCFALEVSNVINTSATSAGVRTAVQPPAKGSAKRKEFRAAPCGVTCGVSTGRAFVGPLGTDLIRRHTIISNAVLEATALERMVIRYPNCSVMIGGDTIPLVEGYAQYLLVDATLLPGSGGKRRRIASVKAVMCADGCVPEALRGVSDLEAARQRRQSPYAAINGAFNAFLEGRNDECRTAIGKVNSFITETRARQAACATTAAALGVASGKSVIGRGADDGTSIDEQCIDEGVMCMLLKSLTECAPPVDGRSYCCPIGHSYAPEASRVLYAETTGQCLKLSLL